MDKMTKKQTNRMIELARMWKDDAGLTTDEDAELERLEDMYYETDDYGKRINDDVGEASIRTHPSTLSPQENKS